MLLNYKNESSTNVSKYYRLAIYKTNTKLANTKHFCGNSNSQMVNIQIVKSFSRPKELDLKWWLIIAPGEILPNINMGSW